ncbi:unnamed protein product [Didymodactylos carnosus]|uniref:Uncharacterized protein n=1 Tax=Didymodactylos carnosus TaxID=1234261 RepID=A0A815YVM8_9BILA|nr:unnamed protein product [Didymodactylos carnosus]CAF4442218.1 unnamed protein product [Didymodactylos carnosus]
MRFPDSATDFNLLSQVRFRHGTNGFSRNNNINDAINQTNVEGNKKATGNDDVKIVVDAADNLPVSHHFDQGVGIDSEEVVDEDKYSFGEDGVKDDGVWEIAANDLRTICRIKPHVDVSSDDSW